MDSDGMDNGGMADIALVERHLAGDDSAFKILYDRYKNPIYGFLVASLGSPDSAAEVFQNTWIRVARNLHSYTDKDNKFLAWLFSIARNQATDYIRRNIREPAAWLDEPLAALPDEDAGEPWEHIDAAYLRDTIEEALASLPREQREVVLMRIENMDFHEIAAIQHCSINTAVSRMRYGLRRLREFFMARREFQ